MDNKQLDTLIHRIDAVTATVLSTGGGLSNKVPYTGATTNVNLGNNKLFFGTGSAFDIDLIKSVSGAPGVIINAKNTSTGGFTGIQAVNDLGTVFGAIFTVGSLGNVGGLYANNTSWLETAADVSGITNEQASGQIVFATGGFAAANERFRITSTGIILVNKAATPGGALSQMKILKGTGTIDLGEYTANRGAIWFNQSTPTSTNWSLSADTSGNTFLNAMTGGNVDILVNGSIIYTFSSTVLTFNDAINIAVGTTTGTKIGTATSQKISFWNATPDVQPTTAIVGGAFVAGTSGITDGTATYGGYTGGQIVAALKRAGLLA